jgi:Mn-dependent DtxR family transcriptional regulator
MRHDPIESVERNATRHKLRTMARRMAVARRSVSEILPVELVHDPALDILLALYQSDEPIAVDSLSFYTTVSAATATRWVKALESRDLVQATAGWLSLTDVGVAHMDTLLTRISGGRFAL